MAMQKLAKKRRDTEAEARKELADSRRMKAAASAKKKSAKSREIKIRPIEAEHVPRAWRHSSLKIEPLFDSSMRETPMQISVADIRAALERPQEPQLEDGAFAPINPVAKNPISTSGPEYAGVEIMSPKDLLREQQMEMVRHPVQLRQSATTETVIRRARITRYQVLMERLHLWFRQVLAMLSHLQGPQLTSNGQLTLRQLQRLYALIGAGFTTDDMDMVRLRVAYGEAYYHVMEASRRRKANRRKDEPGEYQAYIERFLATEQ